MDELRPVLPHARQAADDLLSRLVTDGVMTPRTAAAMRTDGFRVATKNLSELRKSGLHPACVTALYEGQLAAGRAAGNQRCVNSAEFTLAVWDGMQRDLAEWLGAES
jgi:hypothetical protein